MHRSRLLVVLAAIMLVASACSSAGTGGSAGASGGTKQYKIGYSNGGGVGNGFREEQVCTAKAQAKASGQVSELTVKHRNTDAAGQAADIRDLIAKGVNAIVFNPNDKSALDSALADAKNAGIKTVAVDAYVTNPDTYNLYNNQVKYAELGAKWLFDQLKGTGTVWYMRGLAGHPADADRDTGFKNVLKSYPNIKVVPTEGQFTGWDPAKTTQLANEFISSGQYDKVDGIWTSGMDSQVVSAIQAAKKPYKPIVGADLGAFVTQLLDDTKFSGLKGAAVTNTASVGGAGITLALKLLNGESVQADPNAGRPNTVLLDPVLVDNTTDAGKTQLKSWQSIPGMDPLWPLSLDIKGWTTYDAKTVPASCKGA
jgi:ribose transport system substrate-binding protein